MDRDDARFWAPRIMKKVQDGLPYAHEILFGLPIAIQNNVPVRPRGLERDLLVSVSVFQHPNLWQPWVPTWVRQMLKVDWIMGCVLGCGGNGEGDTVFPGVADGASHLEQVISHPSVSAGNNHLSSRNFFSTSSMNLPVLWQFSL